MKFKPESKGTPDGKGERVYIFYKGSYILLFALVRKGGFFMSENRVAVVSIIVENTDCSEKLNALLHDFGDHIIGRMGVPHRPKKISVLSVVMDAPQEVVNALTGKLGMIEGVSAKTLFSKY